MGDLSILWAIAGFLIVLTPIVLVHELGHFWAAKLTHVEVEEFGFGLPPRALTLAERNGTKYTLNWIPVGGFVRPAGEDNPDVPGGLASASKKTRLFVLGAGAGANFIFAIFLFWLALVIGAPAVTVADVKAGSPAETAGLQAGDAFMEIDGQAIYSDQTLINRVFEMAGQPINLLILRGDEDVSVTIVPRRPGEFDSEVDGPLGVGLSYSSDIKVSGRPLEAISGSFGLLWEYVSIYGRLPSMLMSGEISPAEARPVSIIGISQIAGQAAESTATNRNPFPILSIAAFISIALGLTNLLPIPALDGGRIMFVLIEAVRGRRIEPEREGMVHMIGMLVMLGLMALLIVQDLINPIIPF